MARLLSSDNETMNTGAITGMQAFKFSATRIEILGATEYTLVTIAIDFSGSVDEFLKELREAIKTVLESCKKSPRSDNLLVRVIVFSGALGGVRELHGFKPLSEIDPNDYMQYSPGGMTPLCDAAFSAIGATNTYAQQLTDNDFLSNAIVFIITDGAENASSTTAAMVKEEAKKAVKGEHIESIISILIAVNAKEYTRELKAFKDEAGMDQYIDIGDATSGKLAKLAAFVSQSISSQSQSLGTGGPSQSIAATI
ncbi:MAG: VWA domain-containing protein [Candidatus Colwellbacteria bacterium]|nr:VWA domain-containing protein [Candidatus Colwellbacteria bacterium]